VTKKGVDGRYAEDGEGGYTTILNKKQIGDYALLRVYCRVCIVQRGGSACPRRLWRERDEGQSSSSARAATQADLEVVQLRLEGLDGAVRHL